MQPHLSSSKARQPEITICRQMLRPSFAYSVCAIIFAPTASCSSSQFDDPAFIDLIEHSHEFRAPEVVEVDPVWDSNCKAAGELLQKAVKIGIVRLEKRSISGSTRCSATSVDPRVLRASRTYSNNPLWPASEVWGSNWGEEIVQAIRRQLRVAGPWRSLDFSAFSFSG